MVIDHFARMICILKLLNDHFAEKHIPKNAQMIILQGQFSWVIFSYLTLKVTYKPVEFAYITNNLKVYISKHNIYSYSWIFAFKGEIEHNNNDFFGNRSFCKIKFSKKLMNDHFAIIKTIQNLMNNHSWLCIFMRSSQKSWC